MGGRSTLTPPSAYDVAVPMGSTSQIDGMKHTVAVACRILAHAGLVEDVLGHVSVRLDDDTCSSAAAAHGRPGSCTRMPPTSWRARLRRLASRTTVARCPANCRSTSRRCDGGRMRPPWSTPIRRR